MKSFWDKVEIKNEDECWEWQGSSIPTGYGIYSINSKNVYAHRYSWEVSNNKSIPDGMLVLHECDNPSCVNPKHLFLGTNKDNTQDMVSKKRHTFGSRNGKSKLSEDDVIRIRSMSGSHANLAKIFGVSSVQIYRIRNNKRWTILEKELS